MKKIAIIITVLAVSMSLLAAVAFGAHKDDFQKAVKDYKAGRYEQAVSTLQEYVKEWPEGRAYYLMGYANYALGKQEEAARNFHDAYLVDPEMNPQEFRKSIGIDTGITRKPKVAKMPAAEAPAAPAAKPAPEMAEKPAAAPPAAKPAPAPEAAKAEKPAPAPAPAKPAPKPRPRTRPSAEPAEPTVPTLSPGMLLSAGLVPLVLFGLVYLLYSLSMFIIGRKTGTGASWLAFVPGVNFVWPLVGASGKSKIWILLALFVPFVALYLWMLVAERFGKSKILGLLVAFIIMVPVLNILLVKLLFKEAGVKSASMGLDLPDIPDEFPDLPEVPGMEGADDEYESAGAAEEPSAGADEEEDFFGEGFADEEPAEEAASEEPAEDDFGDVMDEAEPEPEVFAEEEPAEEESDVFAEEEPAEDIFELGDEDEAEEDLGAFEIKDEEDSSDSAPSLEEMGFAEDAPEEDAFDLTEADEVVDDDFFDEEEKPEDF